jgi:hypothetical protein
MKECRIQPFEIDDLVVADQERIGRVAKRLRQGGGEPVDVVSFERMRLSMGQGVIEFVAIYFIQVKNHKRKSKDGSPYVAPAEREALILEAKRAGAIPLLAWKDGEIQYKRLDE